MYSNHNYDNNSYNSSTTPKQESLYPHSTLTPPFTLSLLNTPSANTLSISSPSITSNTSVSPIIPPQLPPIHYGLTNHPLNLHRSHNTDYTTNDISNSTLNSLHSQNHTANYNKSNKTPPIHIPNDDQLYSPTGSSKVWQIFKLYKSDSSWAYCCGAVLTSIHGTARRCGKWFIYHHPTTSNLKNHIYMQHKQIHDQLYPDDDMDNHSTNNINTNDTLHQNNSTNDNTLSDHKPLPRHRNGKIKNYNKVKKRKQTPITLTDIPFYDMDQQKLLSVQHSNIHHNNSTTSNILHNGNQSQLTDITQLDGNTAINMMMHSNHFTLQMCHLLQRIMERSSPVIKQEINAINGQIQPNTIKLPYLDASAAATLKLKHIESTYNTRDTNAICDLFVDNIIYTYHNITCNDKFQLIQCIDNMLSELNDDIKFEFQLFSASSNHITTHIVYSNKKLAMLLTFDEHGLINECNVYEQLLPNTQ